MPRQRGDSLGTMSNPDLPVHLPAHRSRIEWTRPVLLPIPGVRTRRLRIIVPTVPQFGGFRLGRRRGPFLFCIACMAVVFTFVVFSKRLGGSDWNDQWGPAVAPPDPSTLVFGREDLRRIWHWEIASGHFPSRASIPAEIGFKSSPQNPGIPFIPRTIPLQYRPPFANQTQDSDTDTIGIGHPRVYLDIQNQPPDIAYPPRPVPGSVADMDVVMKHCDFSQNKYVRDCLEVLRVGGGLDSGKRFRRGKVDDWKYIYLEAVDNSTVSARADSPAPIITNSEPDTNSDAGPTKKKRVPDESQLVLPPPLTHRPSAALSSPCDSENPRLFHMFWTGPFTDKPYMALLSFLYTQNTGIQHRDYPLDSPVCRPQFWMWINPGPAASVPNPSALRDMFAQLKSNPWATPFLHPRFKDVIKFKLWNTTEQLDGVPELKDEWRGFKANLFNSGGQVVAVAAENETHEGAASEEKGGAPISTKGASKDDLLNLAGSKSPASYDRLSVILSDMARFVLCHRFGGIYLDADTIFLRDWEELWGWKGAFAYRWSRLEKYNTAVLRMNKGSALGTFLFRTALKNGLDFHPMTVSKYTADASVEGLLLRLPDALFDSAWLNTESFQQDRPPQPYFNRFLDLFDTPAQTSAAPQVLGFDGFFKGAYSYHFHNGWWEPFDPSRNWPDLGLRFKAGEEGIRAALRAERKAGVEFDEDDITNDKRDLAWGTVLKRTFEAYVRGERPNMYGEWLRW